MIEREAAEKVLYFARHYPVVTITGPRQSGKTTLCRMVFPEKPYVNLEGIEERIYAASDPKGFLARFPDGAVLDEIQRVPDLLSYIQVIVDEHPRTGRFIITGSHNFELMNSINQSLAGRTALVHLLPFSLSEMFRGEKPKSLTTLLYTGGFPRIYNEKLNPTEAFSFYLSTYIERDLRSLIHIQDLSRFEIFLKLCATRSAQVLNLSSLGNDCGVNHNTIKNWLSILEASYIIKLLHPYYVNQGKRLIKSPKLYFLDTGLASFLLGIQNEGHLDSHPLRGALFETLVVSELLKKRFNHGKTDNLFFLRDSKGHEVDILLDYGSFIDLLEVKLSNTLNREMFKGIHHYRNLYPGTRKCILIYGGDQSRKQYNVQTVPWSQLGTMRLDAP